MSLPFISLGNLRVSRLIAGGNQISGFSHQGFEQSQAMIDYFTVDNVKKYFKSCEENGINSIAARADPFIMRVLREYWNDGGKIQWIAQTAKEYKDPFLNIKEAIQAGAVGVYIHGGQVDRYFESNTEKNIGDLIKYANTLGVSAGVAAHNPFNLLQCQRLGLNADFYLVCMYNITGYQGERGNEKEERFNDGDRKVALKVLKQLDKPCVAYKVMAAGRKSLEEGLRDVLGAIRETDGILIGMFPKDDKDMIKKNVDKVDNLSWIES
jgi:hypothetical protein